MPYSKPKGKDVIIEWIKQKTDIVRILDVGCGAGTYPILLKQENNLLINAEWWGIEAWSEYIERFNLHTLYNHIVNDDARKINWGELPDFDLVIFGDVLEHMSKEDAQQLVNNAILKSKYVVISIPVHHSPQGAWEGNPFEIHVKDDWTQEEVLSSFPNIKDYLRKTKTIGVYWLEK